MRVFIITLNPWIMFFFLFLLHIMRHHYNINNSQIFCFAMEPKKCLFNKFSSATVSLCIYSIGLNVSFSCSRFGIKCEHLHSCFYAWHLCNIDLSIFKSIDEYDNVFYHLLLYRCLRLFFQIREMKTLPETFCYTIIKKGTKDIKPYPNLIHF